MILLAPFAAMSDGESSAEALDCLAVETASLTVGIFATVSMDLSITLYIVCCGPPPGLSRRDTVATLVEMAVMMATRRAISITCCLVICSIWDKYTVFGSQYTEEKLLLCTEYCLLTTPLRALRQ